MDLQIEEEEYLSPIYCFDSVREVLANIDED
jgi:hypothetical protein